MNNENQTNSPTKQDFEGYNKALTDKINEQIKATEKVASELKKINERAENERAANEQKNKAEEENPQPKVEDEILKELKHISELTSNSQKDLEADQKILSLVKKIEKDYDHYHFQSQIIGTYGVLILPALLIFYFLYHILKQFIT
jgi:hypothetical protein